MKDENRRVYLGFGWGFTLLGGVIVVLALVQQLGGVGIFRGNPFVTGVFLAGVGVALLWTVRGAEREPDGAGDPADGPVEAAVADGAAGETREDGAGRPDR